MSQSHPLKAFRESRTPRLTQEELAQMLGVTKTSISRWEAGERFPERELWPRIKEVTGVEPNDLAFGSQQ